MLYNSPASGMAGLHPYVEVKTMFIGLILLSAILSLFNISNMELMITVSIVGALLCSIKGFSVKKLLRKVLQYSPFAYFLAATDYGYAFIWFCVAILIEFFWEFIPAYREKKKETGKVVSLNMLFFMTIVLVVFQDMLQFFGIFILKDLIKLKNDKSSNKNIASGDVS
jgi:hypothetical protein